MRHRLYVFIDESLKEFYSDILFNCVYWKNKKIKIALLLEHKSFKPKNEFLQLLRYKLNVWDSQYKNNEKLRLVIPIIIYHGKDKWLARSFSDLFPELDEVLIEYFPDFRYEFINLQETPDENIVNKMFENDVDITND